MRPLASMTSRSGGVPESRQAADSVRGASRVATGKSGRNKLSKIVSNAKGFAIDLAEDAAVVCDPFG